MPNSKQQVNAFNFSMVTLEQILDSSMHSGGAIRNFIDLQGERHSQGRSTSHRTGWTLGRAFSKETRRETDMANKSQPLSTPSP